MFFAGESGCVEHVAFAIQTAVYVHRNPTSENGTRTITGTHRDYERVKYVYKRPS